MSQRLIPFEYRSKNGTLQPENCIVYIKQGLTQILGEKSKTVFDPTGTGDPKRMTGLFIIYDAVEYGSITISEAQLRQSFVYYRQVALFTRNFNKKFRQVTVDCRPRAKLFAKTFNQLFK